MTTPTFESITDALAHKLLLADGAMGTMLHAQNLTVADFGGEDTNGCNEYLNISAPHAVKKVHDDYLAAGADIIQTNTFGATPVVLSEYGLESQAEAINLAAATLARSCADQFSTVEKPRYVYGSMGPTTKSLSLTGGISFADMADGYRLQARGLIQGGVDYLLLETAMDTLNLKAAYCGATQAFTELNITIPVAVSVTIETMGTMLAGQNIEALYTAVSHMNPIYVGLNCATGPDMMLPHLHALNAIARTRIAIMPNAGMPDENGHYPETPQSLAEKVKHIIELGLVNVIGGCCGTTPAHIQALSGLLALAPRTFVPKEASRISGLVAIDIVENKRPYLVGERTNVIGSKAFRELIAAEKFDEATDIARRQVNNGAHIIDVCLSNPDRDEQSDMDRFLEKCAKLIRLPLMVDSQNAKSVETAFRRIQGKCVLNSVNMEENGKFIHELAPLIKQYGAMVVIGCIEDRPAIGADEKMRIARHAYSLLKDTYHIPDEDMIFDTLVFPCATGEQSYIGSARQTIEAIRMIKTEWPNVKTVLGVSNVSFGLPLAGREVLNMVFLDEAVKAGLDMAIVNAEKMRDIADIPEDEIRLCRNLLYAVPDQTPDPIAEFAAHFREKKTTKLESNVHRTWQEQLTWNIIEGTRDGMNTALTEGLKILSPLAIINGPLMAGMDQVGQRFNANDMIVAEVLQSAEVMKSATAFLEPFMDKASRASRGKIVIATVKGDVHDIGKNLVRIIFSNNGYEVIDLGINCPAENLISAYNEHQPDAIGLSSLLVKSAQEMVHIAGELAAANIAVPLLIGGAALSLRFATEKVQPAYSKGPVHYCKDAMSGFATIQEVTGNVRV